MQSAAERRVAILEYLCECRQTTRERLATEFGVSNRTIERYLLVLSCSYPIYTVQGTGGGIFIDEDYRLGKKYMTDKETALLERIASRLNGDELETMQAILKKFKEPKRGRK